jgi:hypothetical protein
MDVSLRRTLKCQPSTPEVLIRVFDDWGELQSPSADEVSNWLDRHGAIANADVVRIAKIDTLKASKLLAAWREQGLLAPLPGRGKRNMAYAKPAQGGESGALLSLLEENNAPTMN